MYRFNMQKNPKDLETKYGFEKDRPYKTNKDRYYTTCDSYATYLEINLFEIENKKVSTVYIESKLGNNPISHNVLKLFNELVKEGYLIEGE